MFTLNFNFVPNILFVLISFHMFQFVSILPLESNTINIVTKNADMARHVIVTYHISGGHVRYMKK